MLIKKLNVVINFGHRKFNESYCLFGHNVSIQMVKIKKTSKIELNETMANLRTEIKSEKFTNFSAFEYFFMFQFSASKTLFVCHWMSMMRILKNWLKIIQWSEWIEYLVRPFWHYMSNVANVWMWSKVKVKFSSFIRLFLLLKTKFLCF